MHHRERRQWILLDPLRLPFLKNAHILVELHDFKVEGISDELKLRFRETHTIETIRQQDRDVADFPFRSKSRFRLPRKLIQWVLSEHRPVRMSWYWMEPKSAFDGPTEALS